MDFAETRAFLGRGSTLPEACALVSIESRIIASDLRLEGMLEVLCRRESKVWGANERSPALQFIFAVYFTRYLCLYVSIDASGLIQI